MVRVKASQAKIFATIKKPGAGMAVLDKHVQIKQQVRNQNEQQKSTNEKQKIRGRSWSSTKLRMPPSKRGRCQWLWNSNLRPKLHQNWDAWQLAHGELFNETTRWKSWHPIAATWTTVLSEFAAVRTGLVSHHRNDGPLFGSVTGIRQSLWLPRRHSSIFTEVPVVLSKFYQPDTPHLYTNLYWPILNTRGHPVSILCGENRLFGVRCMLGDLCQILAMARSRNSKLKIARPSKVELDIPWASTGRHISFVAFSFGAFRHCGTWWIRDQKTYRSSGKKTTHVCVHVCFWNAMRSSDFTCNFGFAAGFVSYEKCVHT